MQMKIVALACPGIENSDERNEGFINFCDFIQKSFRYNFLIIPSSTDNKAFVTQEINVWMVLIHTFWSRLQAVIVEHIRSFCAPNLFNEWQV